MSENSPHSVHNEHSVLEPADVLRLIMHEREPRERRVATIATVRLARDGRTETARQPGRPSSSGRSSCTSAGEGS